MIGLPRGGKVLSAEYPRHRIFANESCSLSSGMLVQSSTESLLVLVTDVSGDIKRCTVTFVAGRLVISAWTGCPVTKWFTNKAAGVSRTV